MNVYGYRKACLSLVCLFFSTIMMAQSKHMTFHGISLDKKATDFCQELVQKGFTQMDTQSMRGNVWDLGVLANVIDNVKTHKVNSVTLMTSASHYVQDKKDKASLNEMAPRLMSYLLDCVLAEYKCIDVTGKPYVKGTGQSWDDEQTGDWHMPPVYVAGRKGRPCGIIDLYLREVSDDICIFADFVDIKNAGIEELHRIEEE